MTREAFGPNLRRIRLQNGISLDRVAQETKVSESLWAALERNDCSRWPRGIFARSYIRHYAEIIGVDPDTTVDEFCRYFPQGDRRAERTIRGHAEIVGHDALAWEDPVPAADGDRREAGGKNAAPARGRSGALTAFSQMFVRLRRTFHRA
jgi:transcriptional regulator with XRE-family HTH domain